MRLLIKQSLLRLARAAGSNRWLLSRIIITNPRLNTALMMTLLRFVRSISAGNFPAVEDQFIADVVPETYQVTRFYQDDYGCRSGTTAACDQLTSDLVTMINGESAQIITYSGHGAITGWSGEQIFNTWDLPNLTNGNRFPVFFSLDCVDGFWYYPPGLRQSTLLWRRSWYGRTTMVLLQCIRPPVSVIPADMTSCSAGSLITSSTALNPLWVRQI